MSVSSTLSSTQNGPTTSAAVRRRDLTPCLLFPELMERGGGLARAVCERASLYARHYESVVILTTGFSPGIDTVVAALKARGALDERVTVRNFFQHSRWVQQLGVPPKSARTARTAERVASHRQRLPGGPFLRLADRNPSERRPNGYRYFDPEGRLLATTRTGRDSKHELDATIHGPKPRDRRWSTIVADWVDEELAQLENPVLFSLQRTYNDPVLLATRKPIRKVASLHNCHYIDPQDSTSGIRGIFRALLARPRAVQQIVCLTRQQRSELERDVPGAVVRNIPYPGRPPKEQPGPKDLSLVVLVAQLVPRKRVDHAIRAFAHVVRSVPDARLEVYGEGPDEPALRRLIEELGLANSVTLMGYSLTVDRAQARAACNLMTSTFEGYARVISESMSLGTPVVAYDVRYGPRDLIRHGIDGLLVEVHEPEALADAIIELLSDPPRALEMGIRASEIVERLPITDFEQAWLDVVRPTFADKAMAKLPQSDLVRRVVRRLRAGVAGSRRRAPIGPEGDASEPD